MNKDKQRQKWHEGIFATSILIAVAIWAFVLFQFMSQQ